MLKIFWCLVFALLFWGVGCENAEVSLEMADENVAQVEFLDVGQGLSVLFSVNGRKNAAVFDVGNDSTGFWDSLKVRGIRHLDWILVSHWHRDHAGSLLEWDGTVQVDTLFYGGDTSGVWLRDSVFSLAKKWKTPTVSAIRGKILPCDLWKCKVLWMPEFSSWEGNSASAVLQIADGKSRALFVGDLERDAEEELMEMSADLRAELLQVGHHGSKTSSSLPFLAQVSPAVAVISVGKGNGYGHPAKETMQKLFRVVGDSSCILRTDLSGTIAFDWKWGKGIMRRNQDE